MQKDMVKVPPIVIKLRQKRLKVQSNSPVQFPSIDKFIDRLRLREFQAKEMELRSNAKTVISLMKVLHP
jgi:hypothetical protein